MIIQTYKVLKFKRSTYLYNLLDPYIINYNSNLQSNSIQTRSKPFFNIPYLTKKIYDSSFTMQAMCAWNELDDEVRNINKLSIFKIRIKKILQERANRVA